MGSKKDSEWDRTIWNPDKNDWEIKDTTEEITEEEKKNTSDKYEQMLIECGIGREPKNQENGLENDGDILYKILNDSKKAESKQEEEPKSELIDLSHFKGFSEGYEAAMESEKELKRAKKRVKKAKIEFFEAKTELKRLKEHQKQGKKAMKSLKQTSIEELKEMHSKLVQEINEKLKDFPPVPTTNRDKEKKGHKYPNKTKKGNWIE